MPKKRHRKKSRIVRITVHQTVYDYLTDLVDTGLYGNGDGEAARKLIADGIERAIKENMIGRRSVKQDDEL